MKTDTLTGPNLSMQVAILDGEKDAHISDNGNKKIVCYVFRDMENVFVADEIEYDYADPATFQPIAEREKISCAYISAGKFPVGKWQACTINKKAAEVGRYSKNIFAIGDTEAEARMRCYVKSYLGDDTKGE